MGYPGVGHPLTMGKRGPWGREEPGARRSHLLSIVEAKDFAERVSCIIFSLVTNNAVKNCQTEVSAVVASAPVSFYDVIMSSLERVAAFTDRDWDNPDMVIVGLSIIGQAVRGCMGRQVYRMVDVKSVRPSVINQAAEKLLQELPSAERHNGAFQIDDFCTGVLFTSSIGADPRTLSRLYAALADRFDAEYSVL